MKKSGNRPYWHVDAKWILGIVLVFVLSFTLLMYNLWFFTSEKIAVNTTSTLLASMFSPNGIDDAKDFEKVQEKIEGSKDKRFQPFPGLKIYIEEQDLQTLSPRELRIKLFRQLAEPVYQLGPEGVMTIAEETSPEMKEKIINDLSLMGMITHKNHLVLQRIFIFASVLLALLLIPFIYFSYGFGRIGNLGAVTLAASLPGALVLGIGSNMLRDMSLNPTRGEEGGSQIFGNAAADVLLPLVQQLSQNYLIYLKIGIGFILIAMAAKMIWYFIGKSRGKKLEAPAKEV